MSLAGNMEFLNELEERFPVDSWVIDGIHVWPLLRIALHFELGVLDHQSDAAGPGRTRQAGRFLAECVASLVATVADFRRNERPDPSTGALFLSHTQCRVFKIGGRWYDLFCEPLAEELQRLGCRSLILEHAPRGEYRTPRHRGSKFIQLQLHLLAPVNVLLPRPASPLAGEASFADFLAFVAARDRRIRLPDARELAARVRHTKLLAGYYRRLFRKCSASLAFVVNYYSLEAMAFILACREAGITSVDIQHGAQGELHPAYGRWSKLPPGGYELLPDVFWCWSDAEAEAISGWSKGGDCHRALVGGNAGAAMFQGEESGIVRQFDAQLTALKERYPVGVHVLVTLQPDMALPELLEQAIDRSPGVVWWMRLHPSMASERDAVLTRVAGRSNVNVEEASQLPLYALLRHMDVHATAWSSTVIEAASFGVPSVLYHRTGCELFASYLEEGIAVAAEGSDELVAAVYAQKKRRGASRAARPASSVAPLERLLSMAGGGTACTGGIY